ncbi:MAG TPA: hypothetical protein VH255_06480 [Verrucomicrobiae bacterium]|jgi:hypothetical protein|nr:hypothetical protein [Verrucomicrobiae bacterium]
MQASKISLMICLGAVSLIPLLGRADEDTPAQARLRDALHAAEEGRPLPAAPAAPAAPVVTTPAEAAPAAPVETPVVTAPAEPTVVTPPATLEALPAGTPAAGADMSAAVAVADTNAIPMAETAVTNAVMDTNVAPPVDQTMMTNAVVQTPAMPDMTTQTNMASAEAQAMKQADVKPVHVPVPVLTADQQQRLEALTMQYKADQISPQQYHEQRAKIIAGQ